MTLDEWLCAMPKDERDTVCLADAWNYQQARISLLEAAGAKIISAIRAGLSQDELEAMEEFELLLQEDK